MDSNFNIDNIGNNTTIKNLDTEEIIKLHEAQNPQHLISTLQNLSTKAEIKSDTENNDIVDGHKLLEEFKADLESSVTEYNNFIDNQNNKDEISSYIEDDKEEKEESSMPLTIIKNDSNDEDIKNILLSKEDFSKFVKSLNILKTLKKNIIFKNGIAKFISDSGLYACNFNTHIKNLSFNIPSSEQQASQLAFLAKSKNAINIIETEDNYTFSDGMFKFQIRKSINSNNEGSKFDKLYKDRTSGEVLGEYEFTDSSRLEGFLSIIKGLNKKESIDIRSSDDMKELILYRGTMNSGRFELLRFPCNNEILKGKSVESLLDSLCLLYDFKSMKIRMYYMEEYDIINIVMSGTLNEDFDITLLTMGYRTYLSRNV